jgi:hypothetical protein
MWKNHDTIKKTKVREGIISNRTNLGRFTCPIKIWMKAIIKEVDVADANAALVRFDQEF